MSEPPFSDAAGKFVRTYSMHGRYTANALACLFQWHARTSKLIYTETAGNHVKMCRLQCQRMSALCRQRALEWRRQCYRERRADETTAEKERRLQSERERQRRRLLGESAEPIKEVVRGFEKTI